MKQGGQMGFVAGSALGLAMGVIQSVMMKSTFRETVKRGGQGALLSGLAFTGFLSIGAALRQCI
jgi:deoxyxylulose-5-phosphate synthase